MERQLASALDEAFVAVERALSTCLATGEAPPAEVSIALTRLIELAGAAGRAHVGQIARAMQAFIEAMTPAGCTADSAVQLRAMLGALTDQLRPGDQGPRPLLELVRKLPEAIRREQPVCLLLDSRSVALALEANLKIAGFPVESIDHLPDFDGLPAERLPAAILADLSLLRAEPQVREAMQRLRERRPGAHLFCLSTSNAFDVRLEAVRLGATRFLTKPLDYAKLVAMLDGILLRRDVQPMRALLIDDDRALTSLNRALLESAGLEVAVCNRPAEALDIVATFQPDVIVSDIYMPGCNGLELAAVLRQDEALFDTPIVFLSTETDIRRQLEALDLGGDDFLTKPVDRNVLIAAVIARAKRARMLKRTRRELESWKNQLEAALAAG